MNYEATRAVARAGPGLLPEPGEDVICDFSGRFSGFLFRPPRGPSGPASHRTRDFSSASIFLRAFKFFLRLAGTYCHCPINAFWRGIASDVLCFMSSRLSVALYPPLRLNGYIRVVTAIMMFYSHSLTYFKAKSSWQGPSPMSPIK